LCKRIKRKKREGRQYRQSELIVLKIDIVILSYEGEILKIRREKGRQLRKDRGGQQSVSRTEGGATRDTRNGEVWKGSEDLPGTARRIFTRPVKSISGGR